MRYISTIIVFLLTFGLGFLVVMQQKQGNLHFLFGAPPLEKGGKVYNFDPAEVGRIHILNNDGTRAVLIKKGGAWMMDSPWKDYADARTVKSLIDLASNLQIEDVIDRDDVEDLAELGLKKSRIAVEIFDKGGSALCHFRMGRYTAWRGRDFFHEPEPGKTAPSFPTLVIRPSEDDKEDYIYICKDINNPDLRLVPIRDLFQGGLTLFRDHRVFHNSPGFAGKITLKEKNSEISISRANLKKDTPWQISKPYDLAASPASVARLLRGLAALQATQVLDPNALALPEPLPENIDRSITLSYFLPDGSLSSEVTALIYPPENEQSPDVRVVIKEGPTKNRAAILRVPRGLDNPLASLPSTVNDLRSRTLTSLAVRDIDSVEISDLSGRALRMSLEYDPHERSARWHALVGDYNGPKGAFQAVYQGPSNERQTGSLFEALCKDEVIGFPTEALTAAKSFGFEQPVRRIRIALKNGKVTNYVIGEKLRPQYFARRAAGGGVLEISEEAYLTTISGKSHRETSLLIGRTEGKTPGKNELPIFGLDRPKVVTVSADGRSEKIHLGRNGSRHFYANRLDEKGENTPHVIEIPQDALTKTPLRPFNWRPVRLWNISSFEVKGLNIKRPNQKVLELDYNDYSYTDGWAGTQGGKDITALINPYKAEKLLRKLCDIEVHKWLGPIEDNAAYALESPALEISVLIEVINENGEAEGLAPHTVKLAPINSSTKSPLYFGSTSSDPNFFLIDAATFQRLTVQLLEK